MSNSKEIAIQNLFDFADILEEMHVPFFLDSGTLLGAYRDKDFCKGDQNDIDLSAYADSQFIIPKIIKKAEEAGFKLYHHWTGDPRAKGKAQQIAVTRGKCFINELDTSMPMKIDLFFYEKKDDKAFKCVYDNKKMCIPVVIPRKYIKTLDTLKFYGREFKIPNNIEDYLSYYYGDWKTPVHRKEYSCYNPEQLKSLKPNFKFYE